METANADAAVEAKQDAPAEAKSEAVTTQTDEEAKTFDAEYVKSLRHEAAKYRTQAKEMAEKAKAYDDYKESQKSEQEKLTDQLKQAEDSKAAAERELLRMRVASSKNLPNSLVERLRGDTVEELEADADSLLGELKQQFVERSTPAPNQTGAGVVGEASEPGVEDFLEVLRKRG